ncbi:Transposase DDE domain protein [compost metagenome]
MDYVLGLQINPVLKRLSAECLRSAERSYFGWRKAQGRVGKTFTEFTYRAGPWKRSRRVIAKAEFGPLGPNQRYVVTNLTGREPRQLYAFYCQRGQAENRIKDLKCALSANRFSCSQFKANAFRLILHVVAYRLCKALSEALSATPARSWQFDTLRLRLLKVAARIEQKARRAVLHLPRSYPFQSLWRELAYALAPPIVA